MKKRSIGLAILFTILTCGIYGLYWMVQLTDESRMLAGDMDATSGGMVLLFSIITCGITVSTGITAWASVWTRCGKRRETLQGTWPSSTWCFPFSALESFPIPWLRMS